MSNSINWGIPYLNHPEDFLTPDTLREEVFHQLGENVVSRKMDFRIGYFKRNVKIWINKDQDSKEAWETLEKVGKFTLWCIGIENVTQKGDGVV